MTPTQITELITHHGGNVTKFAQALEVSRRTVQYWKVGHCKPERWQEEKLKKMYKKMLTCAK